MKTKSQPKKISKPLVVITVVLAAVTIIFGIKFLKGLNASGTQAVNARVTGDANAPVKITEWVDFQCPACGVGMSDLKKYMDAYPGKIYLELKYFPLGGHVHSLQAAKYGECAAQQGKFWPYAHLVFERQPKWRDLFDAQPVFEEISTEIGLDAGRLKSCLANDATRETVLAEKDAGQKLGVQSTPTYFVNGKMFVGPKLMREEVNKLLGIKVPEPVPAAETSQ